MRRSIDLVINPRAGAGRAARVLGDVTRELAAVGFDVQVHPTARPGHAGELVRQILRRGEPTIVGVMGGDGSLHEALAGLYDATGTERTAPSDATFAVIPAGTGGDLRRTLGVPEEPAALARWLVAARPRAFDLGEIEFVRHDGVGETRRFANVASFGIGGVVDQLANAGPKWLGGRASFLLASARASLGYRNVPVRVTVDDEPFFEGPAFSIAVANGRAFGGGMLVAPEADPHDGLFDVVALGDLSRLESTALPAFIYRGAHLGRRQVFHRRGRTVRATATSSHRALLDLDGEAPGMLTASFRVLPGAIQMLEHS